MVILVSFSDECFLPFPAETYNKFNIRRILLLKNDLKPAKKKKNNR